MVSEVLSCYNVQCLLRYLTLYASIVKDSGDWIIKCAAQRFLL